MSQGYFNSGPLWTLTVQPLVPRGRDDNGIYDTQSLLPGLEQRKRKSNYIEAVHPKTRIS